MGQAAAVNTPPPSEPTDPDASGFAAQVLRAEAEAVLGVIEQLDENFPAAVQLMTACEGSVITGGMGKSGIIARKISATLASTGTPSHCVHPTEAMHGDLGRIREQDVLLLLSYGGGTEDVLALAALARQDGVKTIGVSGRPGTHLARICDVHLCVGDVTEACPHKLAPTTSTTTMLALGDALALAASRDRNFSAEDFHKRHPGGQLGRQMTPLVDVLRFKAGENLPLVREDRTVDQVLAEADQVRRRAGAVILVDERGRMTGIFTDGDLRRLLVHEGAAGLGRAVEQVMTRRPRSLDHHARVRDAVQLARELRVDEIPVLNDEGKPLGLVDVQDLVALKVIEESA